MRKVLGTALIALMVLLIASCDSGEELGVGDDGLVTVNIGTGDSTASRSLIDATAQVESTYVEVIFKNGTTYYRAGGYLGAPLSIKIAATTYNLGDAIVLIGRSGDGTLLATGVPSSGSLTVLNTTTSITFDVTSLTADIHANTSSAFSIDESTGSPNTIASITTPPWAGKTKSGLFYTAAEPCFQVPLSTSAIGADLTITGFASTGGSILVNGTPKVLFNKIKGTGTIADAGSTIAPASSSAVGTTGKFSFTFASPATAGLFFITFDIPVVAFSPSISGIQTWHIRGGTQGGIDFTGSDAEGVPLLVTDDPSQPANVTIETNWT